MNIIVITGQTATGKTGLALEMAKKHNGELVNFDSRQIYKYLDIITGKDLTEISKVNQPVGGQKSKPSLRIKKTIGKFDIGYYSLHPNLWLYDIVTPDQYFSSFDFVQCANIAIDNITKRGKTPILVGGSYFYLKHLLYGFDTKVPPNFKLRKKLNKKSVSELQTILKSLSTQSVNELSRMNNSDRSNPRRLIRRIEIELSRRHSGERVPRFSRETNDSSPDSVGTGRVHSLSARSLARMTNARFRMIGLHYLNKDKLRTAIKERIDKRLKQGAIEEVEALLKKGYKETDPGIKTLGYKQIIDYFEGRTTKDGMIDNWIIAEVQYAKRQYTFMKKDENISWKEI